MEPTLGVYRMYESVQLPTRTTAYSVGWDLYSMETFVIEPYGQYLASTGLVLQIPAGHYVRLASRSGLAWRDSIHVGAGVIDPDYIGEVQVLLHNLGNKSVLIQANDRIAQLILERASIGTLRVLAEPPRLGRTQGMGSSGE